MDDAVSTRERLIALATAMFAEQGYASVSVRDLADRAGLTSGAIYGNFGSKAGLLLAAIDAQIFDELVQEPPEGISEIADVDAFIFGNYPDRRQMRALLLEGAVAARSDDEVRTSLGDDHTEKLHEWSAIYKLWQDRGEIDPDLDIRAVLVALWSMELGIGVLESLGVDLPDPAELGAVVGRFMRGVAPPGD